MLTEENIFGSVVSVGGRDSEDSVRPINGGTVTLVRKAHTDCRSLGPRGSVTAGHSSSDGYGYMLRAFQAATARNVHFKVQPSPSVGAGSTP